MVIKVKENCLSTQPKVKGAGTLFFFNSPEYTATREARADTAKFAMSIVPGM